MISGQAIYTANFTPDTTELNIDYYTINGGTNYTVIGGNGCKILTLRTKSPYNVKYWDTLYNGTTSTTYGTQTSNFTMKPISYKGYDGYANGGGEAANNLDPDYTMIYNNFIPGIARGDTGVGHGAILITKTA